MSSSPSASDALALRERVQAVIDGVIDDRAKLLADISPDLVPMTDAIADLLSGGKRMRPAFCYWGWRGAGGAAEDDDAAIHAAAALEFLQACAVIHDDVMDGSDTRRGQPSAHRRFAAAHQAAGWLGSSDGFGVGAAILIGDLCLSWADEALLDSGFDRDTRDRAKSVYDEMRTEVMAGQFLDLVEQVRGGGSVDSALRVVRFKAAKYTVERPLHLGAALADASDDLVAAYTAYGLPLGEAFQLRDDVLGVFGDPQQTGKPAGDDLREGKRTVLIALTLDRADAAQAETVGRLLGDPALGPDGVATLRAIIEETGALESAEAMIAELLDSSLKALAAAPITSEAATALTDLAHAATARTV